MTIYDFQWWLLFAGYGCIALSVVLGDVARVSVVEKGEVNKLADDLQAAGY